MLWQKSKRFLFVLAVLSVGILVGQTTQPGYTSQFSTWLRNSIIDATPIGSTTPAAGYFTTLSSQNGLSTLAGNTLQYGSSVGCTTGGGSYNTCNSVVNWNIGFSGTSYYAACSIISPIGFPAISGLVRNTSNVSVTIRNGTANGATPSGGGITCIGVQL